MFGLSITTISARSALLLALFITFSFSGTGSLAQGGFPVVFETRIALPETAEILEVDEVIFRWTVDESTNSGIVSVADGTITNLAMKVDDTTPDVGGVFIDFIIIDGDVQPLVSPVAGDPPPSVPRLLSDVIFEVDLDTLQVLAFRNLVNAEGSEGTVYKVEGSGGGTSYEVFTYPAGADKSWPLARDAAEDMGGMLAVISTAAEDQEIWDLVTAELGNLEAWVGGFQEPDSVEPDGGWRWLDGGVIPAPGSITNYENWAPGEPNNDRGIEQYLAINPNGLFGWNDEAFLPKIGGFVVEFPEGEVFITRFIDGEIDEEDEIPDFGYESKLLQRTGIVSAFTVRNLFVPEGAGTIFDIDTFEQEGNVVQEGIVNVDVCLAPDPREPFVINGGGKPPKGNGNATGGTINDKEGGTGVYNKDILPVSVLAGRGTCTGDLPFTTEDDDYQNWEDLLADINLVIPKFYRGFFGEVTYTPLGSEEEVTIKAVWLTVVVVRTDGVEYDGPVSSVAFPESFVDYTNTPDGEIPACDNSLRYRSIDVGGANPAFGEAPGVEGVNVVQQTAQCNRSWSLTRRSTHISPMRYTATGPAEKVGREYVQTQLLGIQNTLLEAESCANAGLIDALQDSLDEASTQLENRNYSLVVANLEELASIANADDDFDDGPNVGFNECGVEFNYRGNFVARGIIAAFTTHDRLLFPDPETWEIYPLPEEFEGLVPDLRD